MKKKQYHCDYKQEMDEPAGDTECKSSTPK